LRSQRTNRVEIRFRTEVDDGGVLLVQGGGPGVRDDYLMLVVVRGTVELSYNLGRQGSARLFLLNSSTRVSDGRWHVASLDRLEHFFSSQNFFYSIYDILFYILCFQCLCLQCFDAVGWAAGRAPGL